MTNLRTGDTVTVTIKGQVGATYADGFNLLIEDEGASQPIEVDGIPLSGPDVSITVHEYDPLSDQTVTEIKFARREGDNYRWFYLYRYGHPGNGVWQYSGHSTTIDTAALRFALETPGAVRGTLTVLTVKS